MLRLSAKNCSQIERNKFMIGYLGPSGTFSHQAATEWFGNKEELKQYPTIYGLIRAVNDGEAEKGIVPIENSIDGSINATLDTLAFEADLYITGEYILHIGQNLLVKKGIKAEDIKVIASIPPALGQCSRLLSNEFKNARIEHTNSTAAAAQLAKNSDGSVACIASAAAAQMYGLEILCADCGDEDNNSTRFVLIEKNQNMKVTDHDKSSIAFTLVNEPGSLYNALEMFKTANINMIKIESRPVKKELGEYVFFIDIDGNIDDASIYFALDKIHQNTSFFKFLGSYEKFLL